MGPKHQDFFFFLKLLSDSNAHPRQTVIDLEALNSLLQWRITLGGREFNELPTFILDCMPRPPQIIPLLTWAFLNLWDAGAGKKLGLPPGVACSFIMWKTGQIQISSEVVKVYISSQNSGFLHKSGNPNQTTAPLPPLPLVLRLWGILFILVKL